MSIVRVDGTPVRTTTNVGVQGPEGAQGAKGDPGEGVAAGGSAGQALLKSSGTDYDAGWVSVPFARGGAAASDDVLKMWTEGEAYEATSVTRDSDGVVTTATVVWPDGSAGTFTTTTKNTTWLAVDAFTITHADSGKTVTQAAVTRDSDGLVTTKPALTVA